MRLRNLFEALGEEVAIIFGRFNPPHKGHRAAWELASKSPIWYVGTNESTVGPKDPLPFDVKVEAMKTVWPNVEGHIVAETSWLTLASKVYEKNPKATLLCLTDEDWVTKTIIQYNGKEGAHGFYNFKKIEQKPTPRLSSATALRDAVSKGDRDAFTQAAGVDADTPVAGKPFFDLVAEYLLPYQNAPVKKVAKKKVAEPVESVAEAGYRGRRDAYQRDYDSSVSGMGKRQSYAYQQDGGANDEGEVDEPRQYRAAPSKGMYFYNVPAGKENEARIYGLKQTKSGKWYSKVHSPMMDKVYGPGRYWEPKNEDAAGVGIITKQNSTVDVNKSTPRKNLKAFRLVK
jgi:hypothetical protein